MSKIPYNEPVYDPRVRRLDLESTYGQSQVGEKENWITWEVFHQKKRGEQHIHVGIVHAPDAQLALVLAKESFGRRMECKNLWVVKSSEVYSFSYDDSDMFDNATAPEKDYRGAAGFKVMEKINKYKSKNRKHE